MEDIFVTRQAIYNSHHEVVGYELLFHDGDVCNASPCSNAEQSAQLIAYTFMGVGLENLVGSNMAFLNLSHDFFSNEHPIPMASYQLVLEVAGNCIEDDRIYQELSQLSREGYTISLYDYEYSESTAERLDCVDIVKLDLGSYDINQLKEQCRYYRNHGKRLHIKGIDTDAHQLLCGQLGVDYFQGSVHSPVDEISSRAVVCNRPVLHAIINSVQQHPEDSATLTRIISQDVVLSYKLLRYINCASFAARHEIKSLEQAVDLIGLNTLKQWATLLLTAQPHSPVQSKLPNQSLIRAIVCREMARLDGTIAPEAAYLTGLFSNLDKAMGTPLENLIDAVALSSDITFALLYEEGALGQLLQQVRHYEKEEWTALAANSVDKDKLGENFQLAVQWAEAIG